MRISWTISRYLVGAVLPYFLFSWLLLSVILFVQQASRFSDIFFSVNIPAKLVWQLTFALVPNVIAFTCPMAVLVGVIIGLSKMQGDSELAAIRAAGVGNLQISAPILLLGILLSVFALFINLKGVPAAAGIVREVALETAIYKLESPIEPGVFNTEVAGFTIYVKDGDISNGTWKNIFVYNEADGGNTVRLITSTSGRIDYSKEESELVLRDAVVSTFTKEGDTEKFYSESIKEARYAVKTKRGELIQKLSNSDLTPEELGLSDLSAYANAKEGKDRIEATILWQRRIILSITPFIFAFFGTALVIRFNRKGRGFAIFAALVSLIAYYLLAFLGEQLARTEKISVFTGSLIPLLFSLLAGLWFTKSGTQNFLGKLADKVRLSFSSLTFDTKRLRPGNFFVDLTTGLRDWDVTLELLKFYVLALSFLAAIFLIFTAFELWKFAGTIDNGVVLLSEYLFFLIPFIYLQLAPSAAMIASLATYVIKSRQNEIITWTSAGQSVYKLLLPCVLFMIAIGFVNWQVQERIFPRSNQIQDSLRLRIRSRGLLQNRSGKLWVANDHRIFSFDLDSAASDNVMANGFCSTCPVKNLTIYEFGADKTRLQTVYRSSTAEWRSDRISFSGDVDRIDLADGKMVKSVQHGGEVNETSNPFMETQKKPSQMSVEDVRLQMRNSESEVERRIFAVALEKKYTTPFLPFVIALFTAPFALSLKRTGRVATIGYAVGLWLLFMGVNSTFEQLGLSGSLGPNVAIWTPLMLFAMLGIILLSRTKT